jgi:cysteinyl-tRNA synthetase
MPEQDGDRASDNDLPPAPNNFRGPAGMDEIHKLERQYNDLRKENKHEEADKLRRQIDEKVL